MAKPDTAARAAVSGFTMAYDISFRCDSGTAFETLDSETATRLQQKLERVAACKWRSPTDWDYSPWSGQSSGKFDWGDYRVFADIDEDAMKIIVYEARHRENLYR